MARTLTVVFFDAGGGHRNAAQALKNVLEDEQSPWQVRLLNLQDELDGLDLLRRMTGVRIQDAYNLILRKGWTRLTPQLLPVLQAAVRLCHRPTVKMLVRYWEQNPTDVVLSVIPHFNRALAESVQSAMPSVPFITVLTDLADLPPHFWMERESEYLICGTERAEQQAFELGHDREHVYLASGMVLNPRFYYPRRVDRREERKKLGLDPDLPTGIVLFGGHGSSVMLEIVRRLDASRRKLQLILICGKNQKLLASVRRLHPSLPLYAEGFTREIDYYMALSDFFIGKPGPGSISEALQLHLPVIVACNARTLPQERYNAQWITENRFGIVLKSFRDIAGGVRQLLDPPVFAELRANVSNYSNRALFQIPEFLEEILERPRSCNACIGPGLVNINALQRAAWASLISRTELGVVK